VVTMDVGRSSLTPGRRGERPGGSSAGRSRHGDYGQGNQNVPGFQGNPEAAVGAMAGGGFYWPAWVWFAVMATGNHFWLDCMAGIGVALISMGVVYNDRIRAAFAARRP